MKKAKKKVKPCPACGDKHIYMVHSWPSKRTGWRSKYVECRYCHFSGKSAYTKWGAIRKWNRDKNRRVVK